MSPQLFKQMLGILLYVHAQQIILYTIF